MQVLEEVIFNYFFIETVKTVNEILSHTIKSGLEFVLEKLLRNVPTSATYILLAKNGIYYQQGLAKME